MSCVRRKNEYYDVRVFFAIIKTQIESIIEETHKFYQFSGEKRNFLFQK